MIASNDRDEQRKLIKYNQLVANCVIFYNVQALTRLLRELVREGYPLTEAMVAALSPYLTEHINRFGQYTLDPARRPAPLDYEAAILPAASPPIDDPASDIPD